MVLDTSAIIADARMAGKVFSGSIDDYPDGIIIPVDKPYRWTSADVVRKIKWAACKHFGKKNLKVGHAGTLDPLATGVLLVCVGKACRLAENLQKEEKEYVAGISFGATTPSYDLEKAVDKLYPVDNVSEKTVLELLPRFIGEQEQVAPLFSAKSVDGVRAYELARKQFKDKGLAKADVIEGFDHSVAETLNVQKINIYDLELLAFEPHSSTMAGTPPNNETNVKGPDGRINVADTSWLDLPLATIRISCSKGTYIRAFARDLGEALGSGAHLNSLRRTKTGGFDAETALSVSQAVSLFPTRNREKPDGQDN